MDKSKYIIIQNLHSLKHTIKRMKAQRGRRYLQCVYSTENSYLECIRMPTNPKI